MGKRWLVATSRLTKRLYRVIHVFR